MYWAEGVAERRRRREEGPSEPMAEAVVRRIKSPRAERGGDGQDAAMADG